MKKCIYCHKAANFGFVYPMVCYDHIKEGMKNVTKKECAINGCDTRATQNYSYNYYPLYCAKHKLSDMMDVVNRKCFENGCRTRPTFGYLKGKMIYCSKHQLDNMFYLKK